MADELSSLASDPTVAHRRSAIEAKIAKNKEMIARYESDPATGEGKKELLVRARNFENDREIAKKHSSGFGAASAALQIAIVLASSSILAVSMPMLIAGGLISIIGSTLLLNTVFSLVSLPF
jgi:hypothetical protein